MGELGVHIEGHELVWLEGFVPQVERCKNQITMNNKFTFDTRRSTSIPCPKFLQINLDFSCVDRIIIFM